MAVGISGKDGGLIRARKLRRTTRDPGSHIERALDLGFVGEPEHVDVRVIHALTGAGLIPVIAPVAMGEDGQTYNINADTVAGAVAGALGARRLLMISGGMIPKVENCVDAVRKGVRGAVILDGRMPHACLLEMFKEGGIGTLIRA